MTLSTLWPFKSRDREVIAGLRDQIIELGTHLRFLEADRPVRVVHRARPVRERRKDAGDIIAAKRGKTEQLRAELGRA